MPDILLEKPIVLSIDIVEHDNQLPSLKLSCHAKNSGLKGSFTLSFNFWINCASWDLFSNKQSQEICDLGDVGRIKIVNENSDIYLILHPTFATNATAFSAEIKTKLTDEEYENFLAQFKKYDKWW